MTGLPASSNDVALQLSRLSRELDDTVRQIETAERDAIEKRGAADLAFSRTFLSAQGSVDYRKHFAAVETHNARMEADLAEAVLKHLRRRVDAIRIRIECGRSIGAGLRAEASLINAGVGT